MTEFKSSSVSKGRLLVFAAVILLAAIIALAIGFGLALYDHKRDHDQYIQCDTGKPIKTTMAPLPPTTTSLPYPVSPSVEGKYKYAAVASDAAYCSTVGSDIMARQGGSAVDAAIATILCNGILHPHSCGIGGGHFMVIYNKKANTVQTIMARETAPAAATADMYAPEKDVSSQEGGMAIGVPGELRGLKEAWDIGGKLPWKDLFQPSIKLCNEGIPVTVSLGSTIASQAKFYTRHENLRKMVTNPETGNLYKVGEMMKLPSLGTTLQTIADEGPDAFYNGSLTKNIVQEIQDAGGIITEEDLHNYSVERREPVTIKLRNNSTVYSVPPPSSGGVLEFILNILDEYGFNEESVSTPENTVQTFHRIVEAFKFAYAKRTEFGDPQVEDATFKQDLENLLRNMTSDEYAQSVRSKISDDRTFDTRHYEPTFYSTNDGGTAHLSILAPNGDAVSVTSTINLYFGSKIVGSRTGIVYNDEMDDFSTPNVTNFFGIQPSPANFIKPGKRPLSSMSPTIIVKPDGEVKLVIGASGGSKIITSTVMAIIETLWFDYGIKRAIDENRIHHQLLPKEVQVEKGFPQYIIDGLKKLGHNITINTSAGSIVQGILVHEDGKITANCDFRKMGAPDGY